MSDTTETISPSGPPRRGAVGALISLAAIVVISVGLSGIAGILAPTVLTLILVICANPIRTELSKRGVPGGIGTAAVIATVSLVLVAFVVTVYIAVRQFVEMLPAYSSQLDALGASVSQTLASLGMDPAQIQAAVGNLNPAAIASAVSGALGSVFGLTAALVIGLTMLLLMAQDAVFVPTIFKGLRSRQPDLVLSLGVYAVNVRRYMVVTTLLGVSQGVISALALWIMGIPAPIAWGFLLFLCSYIPNVGYFFALIPPIFFGFLVGGWPMVIAVIVIYGVINAIIQSVIQPRVVGAAVSLSQTLTFFSVLFWAVIMGPIGAILAIPLTLLAKAILIDAHPESHHWRASIGPTAETREEFQADTAAAKEARHEHKLEAKAGLRHPAAAATEPVPSASESDAQSPRQDDGAGVPPTYS